MKHVIQYSGGAASYMAARFVLEEQNPEDVTLLFADTLIEDEDLYRFNRDVERLLNIKITTVTEGRTPWEVFFSERMMGNTRADPCSRILKRALLDAWIDENCWPEDTTIYLGFDANEERRLEGVRARVAPWQVRAPLIERGLFKETVLTLAGADGLKLPRLYDMGFAHNNCGGFCVKAGQGHFALLYEKMPELFMEHARKEQAFRRAFGKNVAILRDRRGGTTTPLPLLELARRISDEPDSIDRFDIGGCNCMEDPALSGKETPDAG